MYFSCQVISQNDWLLQGRHVHYGFTIWVIGLLQFPFMNFSNIHWSIWLVVFVSIVQYKTSSFSIKLSESNIIIKKKVFGIAYFKYSFKFNSYTYLPYESEFIFFRKERMFTLSYEEFEFDEFGFKIDLKYHSLGSIENSNLIFKALKEWKDKRTPPMV